MVECCSDGCPSGRFSHLHRGTLELCQSDHRVLGHLPDQGPSPPIAQFDLAPALGRVLVVPNFFHLRMMILQCCRHVFVTLPQICSSVLSPSLWTIHSSSWLVFFLWHALSTVRCYTQVCAFLNHVQSIEFTTGGVQSSSRNISRMINENRMHLSSILSLITKGLNTYVNKVFLSGFFVNLLRFLKWQMF